MNDINQKIANLSAEKRALLELKLKNKRKNNTTNTSKYQKISSRENHNNAPLSFAQQRLWFLNQLEPNNPFYNIPKAVKLSGYLSIQALQQALDAIVVHHEILHTNYIAENGSPKQIVTAPKSVELKIRDLQQYGQAERETQVEKLLQQESQRSFDLTSDMMLRGCLLQLAPKEYILLLVIHHIAADGWSMNILWEELTQLYQAFLEGKPNPLKTLPIQYADYAFWQREWLSGEVLDKQLNYWKQKLADANPILELPTDRLRPAVQTYRGARQLTEIPQKLSNGLKQLCVREGVTLYMTLLAAFQTLLYRYSKQEDIIVGVPIAGRNRAEIEGLVGFFVNTLALRTDFSGNPNFQELLRRVRSTTLDAYEYQDLPFEKIVEELNPKRSLSHSPLFQVMFDLENASEQTDRLGGLTGTPIQVETKTAKFDLTLSVIEKGNRLIGLWEYNTDLFDAATIERMTGHFQTLLEGIVADPQQSIAGLPLLTTSEWQQLLVQKKDIEIEYQQKCVQELFEKQVKLTPDAIAVEGAAEKLTYQELNARANQLAHYLRTLGVEADKLVGICVERSLEMVIGLLGILKAGAAYVPLDPAYPSERLAYMISDAEISVLVTQNKCNSQLPKHQAQVVYLDSDWQKIASYSQENPTKINRGENLAYVIYTSGSTGKPKGVMISHEAVSNFTQTAISEYLITASDRLLQFASINFDAAVEEIYPCLCTGATLVLRTNSMLANLKTFFQVCEDLSLTVLNLPTAYWHQLATELSSREIPLPESLRLVIIGGERVLPEPVKSWQEYIVKSGSSDRLKLINTYGPTETTVSATLYRVPFNIFGTEEIPIGQPLAHLQTYILDQYQQPVPIGITGELHIGGSSLARGYLNREDLTKERFVIPPAPIGGGIERLYKTGDLARYLPNGNIEYIGRIDRQVKIRGFRIELGEIESALAQHLDISEIVVIAREDTSGDKRLVAYIVSQQKQLYSSQLRSFLKKLLPDYMIPSAFVFLDDMPLTPNGKVDRRALPVPDNTRQESFSTFIAPQDKLESHLAKIWSEVLGIEPIGVEDNFFDLGGNSLQAVSLFAEIEKQFGKNLPLATLFQSATIAEIAQIIRQKEWLAPWESLVPIQPTGSKPPLFYIHAGGGNLLIYRDLAIALGEDRPVYGLQPRGLNGKYSPFSRIEDMADHYLAQIRKLQPNGPYYLAGLSSGGNTAWEMARMLQAQGQEVALLALFDANGPDYFKLLPPIPRLLSVFRGVMFDLLHRWSRLPLQIVLESKQSGTKQTIIKIFEGLGITKKVLDEDRTINQQKMQKLFQDSLAKYQSISGNISLLEKWVNSIAIFLLKRCSRTSLRNAFVRAIANTSISEDIINDISEIPETLQQVQQANIKARATYIPRTYSGKVTLFRASQRFPGFYYDPQLGWGNLAEGGMEIYEIPGNHTSIMKSPVLAEKLKICLDSAHDHNS